MLALINKNSEVTNEVFQDNEFKRLISRIEGQPNYKFMFGGISKLLNNYMASKTGILPDSVKDLRCLGELIIFNLRIFTFNPVNYMKY